MTLVLDTRTLRAGANTWASVTITNISPTPVYWHSDGCRVPAYAWFEMGGQWFGRDQADPVLASAKAKLMRAPVHGDRVPDEFTDRRFLVTPGSCDDIGLRNTLSPGQTLHWQGRWTGDTSPIGLPAVPARVFASFPIGELGDGQPEVTVSLPLQLVGHEFAILTAGQAVDAALDVPLFRRWLHQVPQELRGARVSLSAGEWQLSIARTADRFRGDVRLNATTGAVDGLTLSGPGGTKNQGPPTLPTHALTTTVVRDNVRVTMTVDRAPLLGFKRSVAHITATNIGPDDVHWYDDACTSLRVPVRVFAGGAWAGMSDLVGAEARFKQLVLSEQAVGNADYPFGFFTNDVRRTSSTTTAGGVAFRCTLKPGRSVSETVHWSGWSGGFVLPDVPVTIQADVLFGWFRGSHPPDQDNRAITATLHTWLRTGNTLIPRLLLGQAIDAALTDSSFRSWLENSHDWTFAEVDYDTDTWTIGLRAAQVLPEARVSVDARNGTVLNVVIH